MNDEAIFLETMCLYGKMDRREMFLRYNKGQPQITKLNILPGNRFCNSYLH